MKALYVLRGFSEDTIVHERNLLENWNDGLLE